MDEIKNIKILKVGDNVENSDQFGVISRIDEKRGQYIVRKGDGKYTRWSYKSVIQVIAPSRKGSMCPECSNNVIESDNGEMICSKCGLVVNDVIIESQEWRAFDSEQLNKRSRSGAPLDYTKHNKGITTIMGKDSEISKVASSRRGQFMRMKKWNKYFGRKSKERGLAYALTELQRIVSALSLPRFMHEEIAQLYEKAMNEHLIRGRSIESVLGALTYAITRTFNSPRTLDEIAETIGVEKRDIGRTYRFISRSLKLRIKPSNPEIFIPRFCSILDLDRGVETNALRILKKVKGNFAGSSPIGTAAAAIYLACEMNGVQKTQREISKKLGITEITIRSRCNLLTDLK
jgi:transcription initiation factor TFIIB